MKDPQRQSPRGHLLDSSAHGHLLPESFEAVWNNVPPSDLKQTAPRSPIIIQQSPELAAAFKQPCDGKDVEVLELPP
jgi:hypothetical protein